MSQTPLSADPAAQAYHLGWSAVTRLLRQGWSWSGHERGVAFRGLGRDEGGTPRFATVSHLAGFDFDDDGRALARLDWDRDGDEDLVLTARSGPRLRLLQNNAPAGRRMSFWLVGKEGARDAIGGRVELELEGLGTLVRARRAGEGFLAQSTGWLSFGLGEHAPGDLHVRWPDGTREAFTGAREPGAYRLVRGSGAALPDDRSALPSRNEAPLVPPTPTGVRSLVLAEPLPMPGLAMTLSGGQDAVLFGLQAGRRSRGAGRPMLLNLWGTWCAPCRGELEGLRDAREELQAAGLLVVALNHGDEEERAKGVALLEELEWPHAYGFLSDEALERLDVLQGALQDREVRLPLPMSLLVDGTGRLDSLHFGPVDMDTLRASLVRLAADPADRLGDAVVGVGTWRHAPQGFSLEALESQYRRRGLTEAASEVSRACLDLDVLGELETVLELAGARARQGQWEPALQGYRKATELDPGSFQAWKGVGICLQQQGIAAEAKDAYREALRLDPSSLEVRFNLALVAIELEDYRLARHQAEAIGRLDDERAASLSQALLVRLDSMTKDDGE